MATVEPNSESKPQFTHRVGLLQGAINAYADAGERSIGKFFDLTNKNIDFKGLKDRAHSLGILALEASPRLHLVTVQAGDVLNRATDHRIPIELIPGIGRYLFTLDTSGSSSATPPAQLGTTPIAIEVSTLIVTGEATKIAAA